MELKGNGGLFDTVKSSHTCCVATVFVLLGIRPGLGAILGENGCFWPKTAQIWEGTSRLGATVPGRHR